MCICLYIDIYINVDDTVGTTKRERLKHKGISISTQISFEGSAIKEPTQDRSRERCGSKSCKAANNQ